MPDVTVFALQRSGTNFLEQILKQNFQRIVIFNTWSKWIWKHAFGDKSPQGGKDPQVESRLKKRPDASCLYMTKHPYNWIQSVCENNVDTQKTWKEIKKKDGDETELNCGDYNIVRMAVLWNKHTRWWLNFIEETDRKIYRLRYEDLIENEGSPKTIAFDISEFFGFKYKASGKDFALPKKVSQSQPFSEVKRRIYKEHLLKPELWTFKKIEAVNAVLDQEILERLDYKLYTSKEEFDDIINRYKNNQ